MKSAWISAQFATLTTRAADALRSLPRLSSLDLESSNFDDVHAKHLSVSRSLRQLDLGSTPLTGAGLRHLCRMKQLRSLDLWASNITEMDIELLAELPHLEYLSIGGPGDDWGGCTDQSCHRDPVRFNAETLVPMLPGHPVVEARLARWRAGEPAC